MSVFVPMSAWLFAINSISFHDVDFLNEYGDPLTTRICSLYGNKPDHFICILYSNMNASYPFVSMTQIVDMYNDDNLFYLLKVMLLPFGPYDAESFPYVTLNAIYQNWFGKSLPYNSDKNCSNLNIDYFQSYQSCKQSLMDFFEAGRHSWINYKSNFWNERRRFHVLSVVIRDKITGYEQILATKKRKSVRFISSDIGEIKMLSLQKRTVNVSNPRLKALNRKWDFVAKIVNDI